MQWSCKTWRCNENKVIHARPKHLRRREVSENPYIQREIRESLKRRILWIFSSLRRASRFGIVRDLLRTDPKQMELQNELQDERKKALRQHWVCLDCKSWWAEAMECHCNLRNVQDLLAESQTLCERRFHSPFDGPIVPFGAFKEKTLNAVEFGLAIFWLWIRKISKTMPPSEIHVKSFKIKRGEHYLGSNEFFIPMQDGRNVARRTAVIHRCVHSGRRPQARISTMVFRRNRRSPTSWSRFRSSPKSQEYYGRLRTSESRRSKNETLFRRTTFRYFWIILVSRDKRKQVLMYFTRRPSMNVGLWIAKNHCLNCGSAWHVSRCSTEIHQSDMCGFKASRQRNWLLQELDIFGQESGQAFQNALSVKPWIDGQKKNPNWTQRESNEAFSVFRMMVLSFRKRWTMPEEIENKKNLSDAFQSHQTCQPERFKLTATLCKWLV